MKVLMVISQFHPIIGGAERQAQVLAEKLIEKGVDVNIVTGWWNFRTPRKETIGGIRVFRNFCCWGMWGIKGIRTLGRLAYVVSLAIYLLTQKQKYDIIHVHQVLYPAFISVLLGKEVLHKPVVVKNACSGLTSDIKHLRQFPFGNQQLKYLLKRLDCLVTVNMEGAYEFKTIGYPESKIISIPNGVVIPVESKGHYDHVMSVVTTARLDKQKGIDVLLRAWAKVERIEKTLKLVILGDGPQESELKRLSESLEVADSVEFKGMVHNVAEYLRTADLFILSSRAEGLSNALLEAMSYGIPCIATKVGGNTELLGEEDKEIRLGEYVIAKNGLLVNPDDVKGLSEGILYLLRHQEEREELGKRSRRFIKENYSIGSIADRYISLYQSMLDKRI